MEKTKRQKIQEIIEAHENELYKAGINSWEIDYDIVSASRIKTWDELEKIL